MLIIARTHRDQATAGPMLLVPDTPATPPLQCPRTRYRVAGDEPTGQPQVAPRMNRSTASRTFA